MLSEIFLELDEIMNVAEDVEGLAYVLWDSLNNGLGESDPKIARAASVLSDKASELKNTLEEITSKAEEASDAADEAEEN